MRSSAAKTIEAKRKLRFVTFGAKEVYIKTQRSGSAKTKKCWPFIVMEERNHILLGMQETPPRVL